MRRAKERAKVHAYHAWRNTLSFLSGCSVAPRVGLLRICSAVCEHTNQCTSACGVASPTTDCPAGKYEDEVAEATSCKGRVRMLSAVGEKPGRGRSGDVCGAASQRCMFRAWALVCGRMSMRDIAASQSATSAQRPITGTLLLQLYTVHDTVHHTFRHHPLPPFAIL